MADLSSSFTVAGYQPGVANAFLADTAATAYSGSPSMTSAGAAATATVAGSPYTINIVAGSLTSSSGYEFAFVSSGQLTVNQRPLTATMGNQSKTYGAGDPSLSAIEVGLANVVNGDTVTASLASLTRNPGENVGSYAYTGGTLNPLGGAGAGNYTASFSVANGPILTINPAPLTITANNASKTFNNVPYSGGNGVTYSGFVNGETSSVLSGTIIFGGTSQGAVNIGNYTIIPSGQTSSNYAINYVSGTLTILPPSIAFVQDVLGTAANAAGPTSASMVMNATVLPTAFMSLPGNATLFGGGTVLPYDSDTGATGESANQQTSSTNEQRRDRRRDLEREEREAAR